MTTFFHRLVLVVFLVASAMCGLVVWSHPLSADFIVRAAIIASFGFSLTTAYCRWECTLESLRLLVFIVFVLMGGGFYWSKDHAFGSSFNKVPLWVLLAEYFSIAIAVGLGLLLWLLSRTASGSQE